MGNPPGPWLEPSWAAPLDADAVIAAIPRDATMTGMFLDAVARIARERGLAPTSARPRYIAFQPYALREHCELLVEVARLVFPESTLRVGLRKIGKGTPHVLMRSTVGRVVLGSVEGPHASLRALARSYAMHMRPCKLDVEDAGPEAAIVTLSEVYNFLDSHNVGVFEGLLRHAGVDGSVKVYAETRTSGAFLCTWK